MNRILDTRRPLGRFFFCLISLLLAVLTARASGPATTAVTDTVYRADGTPAAGTLVIAWNAFTTSEGMAIPAGRKTVKIGALGAVAIPLVPNFGAAPEGTYYKVTYKLDDGTTSEEYWSVPAAPATTIAAIRSRLVPASVAVQYATRQYVDSALAALGGGGGGSGNAVKIQGKDVDTAEPARGQWLTFDGTKYKPLSHPEVDVVRDCGAVGDGVTNDGPAIQACINSHPGKTIFFPTTSVSVSGGGPLTNPSYYSAQTLTMSGNNQRLTGDTGGMWSGGAAIRFAAGVTGIHIPSNCYSCKIEHLELQSPDSVATSANGITVHGGHARLSDLAVTGFGNNCIEIDGATSDANSWRASYILMNACKDRGWYAHGSDANAGVGLALLAQAVGTVGFEDGAAYHNTYIASQVGPGLPTPYKDSGGGGAVWIGSYEEGAQPSDIVGMVYGGNMTVATTAANKRPLLWNISNGAGANLGSQTYLEVWNQRNETGTLDLRSGSTTNQASDLRFLTFNDLSRFRWRYQPGTPEVFQLWDDVYGNYKMYVPSGNNQDFQVRAAGNGAFDINLNDGTGGTKFGNGAGGFVALISSSGLGTFYGGVTTTQQLASTVATGTAPLSISSTTPVANLTLASDSQLPAIAESKVTNLVADLAAKVNVADKTGSGAKVPSVDANPADGCGQFSSGKLVSTGSACGSGGGGGLGDPGANGIVKRTALNVTTTAVAGTDYVAPATTVNGHALSANVTVTASDVGLGNVTNDAQAKAADVSTTAGAGKIPKTGALATLDSGWIPALPYAPTSHSHAESDVTNLASDLAARVQLAGDLGGSAATPNVVKIQGRSVASTAPADGNCYKWVAAASEWQPAACAGGGGSANGSTNYVQVNNAGAFGSDSGFQWDLTNHRLGILANGAIDAPVKIGTNAAAGFVGVGPLFAMAYNVNDTNFPSVRYPMGMVDANVVTATNGGANNVIYGSWFSQPNVSGAGFSASGKVEGFVAQGEVTGNSTVSVWNDFSSAPTVTSGSTISRRNAHTCTAHLGSGTVTTEVCYYDQNSASTGYNIVQDGLGKNYLRGKLAVSYQGDPTDALDIGGATGNLYFRGGKGQHIKTQAANNDIVGTVSVSSSTTASVSFTTSYTAAPVCVLTPQTAGLTSWYLSAISATGFTVTVAPSGSYTFGYHCIGNPN